METSDLLEILDNLPSVKKNLSFATSENIKFISKSMKIVLDRELDKEEKKRLKKHSFEMAILQLYDKYQSGEWKLSENEELWRRNLRREKD